MVLAGYRIPADNISPEYVLQRAPVSAFEKLIVRSGTVADLGALTRPMASLSLNERGLWRQVAAIDVSELASYVQQPQFGGLRVEVPAGTFYGGSFCTAHGSELFVSSDHREGHKFLAVYRDGILQRRIGEHELLPQQSAVVGDSVYVGDFDHNCVAVYPRDGGARTKSFSLENPWGPLRLAACGGSVYVSDTQSVVSAFAEDGTFVARVGGVGLRSGGLAGTRDELFVLEYREVSVFCASDRTFRRRLVLSGLRPEAICALDEIVIVYDGKSKSVALLDAANAFLIACVRGFPGDPCGLAVREDGTLFVTVSNDYRGWELVSVPLLYT